MAGGLLNLIALGNQNIILTGNPTKSFFKSTYSKYTNFGLQKFRIDQVGQTELDVNKISKFSFKIMRYGDLLMDMYLVVKLPKIWSPILKYNNEYRPYEFKWIKNIGCQIIKEVNITIDGTTIQKFSGHYIQNVVERDYNAHQKAIFDKMIGNISELNDPANYNNRNNNYPSAYNYDEVNTDISGIEPSISDYNLYIPINSWFSMSSLMALPLICLQYSDLVIDFTLRPLIELYTIKNVLYDNTYNPIPYNNFPQIQANQNELAYLFKRFIHPPPTKDLIYINNSNSNSDDYINLKTTINSNIHLICTQCFLEEEERKHFAKNSQSYLIREVNEYNFEKVIKSNKVKIESKGLISSWMWYFQRSDVASRNEWSNYTNWLYEGKIPNDLIKQQLYYTPHFSYNSGDISKNIYVTGYSPDVYSQTNQCEIMKNFAIVCDGKYREQEFDSNIFSKLEKYNKSNGACSKSGLYCYNFSLTTDPFKLQPNGAFNTNLFKTIEFEYNNYNNPPIDEINSNFTTICDPDTGAIIGVSRDPTSIYKYTYNLHVIEEKYNILLFQNGFGGLVYAK
jgi:hypothetical protein